MTDDEIAAAKTSVEAAQFGELIAPTDEDVKALRAHADAEAVLATADDLEQLEPVAEGNHGKPTLQGR